MKLLILLLVAVAYAEPEAEPAADADADPLLYYGNYRYPYTYGAYPYARTYPYTHTYPYTYPTYGHYLPTVAVKAAEKKEDAEGVTAVKTVAPFYTGYTHHPLTYSGIYPYTLGYPYGYNLPVVNTVAKKEKRSADSEPEADPYLYYSGHAYARGYPYHGYGHRTYGGYGGYGGYYGYNRFYGYGR
jgi:hypothetical protein